MGGIVRDRLCWLPPEEFRRVLDGITDQRERCRAFAALTRINTLYMIMRAGSVTWAPASAPPTW